MRSGVIKSIIMLFGVYWIWSPSPPPPRPLFDHLMILKE